MQTSLKICRDSRLKTDFLRRKRYFYVRLLLLGYWHIVSFYLIIVTAFSLSFMEIPPAEPKAESYLCDYCSVFTSGCSTDGEKKANSSMNNVYPTCRWQVSKQLMHMYQLRLLVNDLTYQVRQMSYVNFKCIHTKAATVSR